MKNTAIKIQKALLLTIFIIALSLPCFAGQHQVIKVIDGDTIDILYYGKKERIRMLCVDTPESVHPDQTRNTPMGIKASNYTKSRLTGKTVDLEFEGQRKRGNYGRLLAYVLLDGHNFNVELVRQGWSPYYTKYGSSEKHHDEFLSAEREAKAKALNIWASGQRNISQSEPGKIKTRPTLTGQYHGNIKSHVFHAPGCRHYNCKNCVRIFNSRDEAIRAGFKPCGMCKP